MSTTTETTARSTGERIALTTDTADRTVSTIYLGVLARASYGSAALVYETMALPCGTWSERYETEAEALKGHARMVEQYLGEVAS